MKSEFVCAIFIVTIMLNCASSAKLPSCVGFVDGHTIPDEFNDSFFYVCQENVTYPMQCPIEYIFCPPLGRCTKTCVTPAPTTTTAKPTVTTAAPATTAKPANTTASAATTAKPAVTTVVTTAKPTVATTPATNICSGQVDGTIYPDSKDCTGYFICTKSQPIAGKCLYNYSFDPITGACVDKVCKN